MKKIFTLIAGLMLTVAAMAADRYPDVTIRTQKNFRVVIDGRSFYSNNTFFRVNNMTRGFHRIEVFEMRRGYFGQRERLVNSTSFRLNKDDVRISIDYAGRIDISRTFDRNDRNRYEVRDWNDRNWNDRSYDPRRDDRSDRRDDDRYDRRDDGRYDRRDDDRRY